MILSRYRYRPVTVTIPLPLPSRYRYRPVTILGYRYPPSIIVTSPSITVFIFRKVFENFKEF